MKRFIEHWYGPHRAEYSIPESELDQHTLPDPLRRLYALAGNWPVPLCYQLAGHQDTSRLLFNHRGTPTGEPVVVRRLSTGRSEGAGYIDQSLFVELVARFAPLLHNADEDVWLAWEINPPRLVTAS